MPPDSSGGPPQVVRKKSGLLSLPRMKSKSKLRCAHSGTRNFSFAELPRYSLPMFESRGSVADPTDVTASPTATEKQGTLQTMAEAVYAAPGTAVTRGRAAPRESREQTCREQKNSNVENAVTRAPHPYVKRSPTPKRARVSRDLAGPSHRRTLPLLQSRTGVKNF